MLRMTIGGTEMPSSEKHFKAGLVAGALGYAVYKYLRGENIKTVDIVKGAFIGGVAALLPDILESATNPNHRSIMHSLAALLAGSYGVRKVNQHLDGDIRDFIFVAFIGFSSHILTDATTPNGIPLI